MEQLFHQLISPSTLCKIGASHEREKEKKSRCEQIPTATNESKVHVFDLVPGAGLSRDKMIRKVSVSCPWNRHFPPSHP